MNRIISKCRMALPTSIPQKALWNRSKRTVPVAVALICAALAGCGKKPAPGQLIHAAEQGDLDRVKELVAKGADVNAAQPPNVTGWQVARIRGYNQVADFLASSGAHTNAPMPAPEALVKSLLSRFDRKDQPGLVVLVGRDGRILLEKGYGLANVVSETPNTPETKFRIGSITKQFTAAAVLKLQEEGKLSVNDSLAKFFPNFPRGQGVTLHHLLTHTSGIHSYTEKPGFMKAVTNEITPAALVASFENDPFDFEPGEKWHYNNSGYFLLGEVIARVSGKSYGEFLKEVFFDPLGMTNTGVYRRGVKIEPEALGYSFEDGKVKRAVDWDMSHAGAAGALYSTVGDLSKWTEALFGGRILSGESLTAMQTPVTLNGSGAAKAPGGGYGYGLIAAEFRGLKGFLHGGGLNGFTSFLAYLPEEKLTIALLGNALPPIPRLDVNALSHEIAQFYCWDKMKPREARQRDTSVDPALYDNYTGRYDYGLAGVMTVRREGDRLFAQLTGQPKFEIFPKSPTQFFWKVVEAQVTFVTNAEGKVVEALHEQGGNEIKAAKLPDMPEAELESTVLEAYVGEYDYGGAIMTISREDGRLFARLAGQPKFEIFPSSETNFFWKAVNAKVTFLKDADGKVSGAIHEQGGRTLEVKKVK